MAKSTNDRYNSAQSSYMSAINNETGDAGYAKAFRAGVTNSTYQNALANSEAKKYAGEQARANAAGAQAQATTAARAAGMNKAQAAMMGAQQNANAYQNAYGNAYNTQLGLANNNIMGQQASRQQASGQLVGGYGTNMSAQQQEGQAEYDRKWGNWGNGLGIAGSLLKPFSDENLKHYKECSKKVTYKAPSKIKTLKFEKKETK